MARKRRAIFWTCVACALGFTAFWALGAGFAQTTVNTPKVKEFRIERSMSKEAVDCIECHKKENPAIFDDWARSRHASAGITCLDCHQAEESDPDVSQAHYKQYERADYQYGSRERKVPISAVVTPKDCSRCHPDEAKQYSQSKHANTTEIIWKIDPWLNDGMNSDFERAAGCFHCHGTVMKIKDG
ncbi:MAG: multiheme c-type cytochrome, partial [Syntrophobacteraceae bacterium]